MKQAIFLSKSNLLLCAGLLNAVILIGCGKEEIKVYTAPKDTATPINVAAIEPDNTPEASKPIPSSHSAEAPVRWKTPSTWKELPASGMRVGSFTITDGEKTADMAVLPFPGSIGSELENVNRWRGEIGLQPVKAGEFTSENVAVGSNAGKLYAFTGQKMSTLAAWLEKDGVHWFFKMRGDKEVVEKNKPALVEFLKSIEFTEVAESEKAEPEIVQAVKETKQEAEGPNWQIPSHWKEGPQKPMVVRNWDIQGEGDKTANVAINFFEKEAGGLVENVNRWRGQLSLAPMSEKEAREATKTLETSDGQSQAIYVDFTGKNRSGLPARMIAAVVSQDGAAWYYKIVGDNAVVEREKTAFLKLIQTASY